jgi:hypothetical protein
MSGAAYRRVLGLHPRTMPVMSSIVSVRCITVCLLYLLYLLRWLIETDVQQLSYKMFLFSWLGLHLLLSNKEDAFSVDKNLAVGAYLPAFSTMKIV